MTLPKVVYNPGAGDVTLTFLRGPSGFSCGWKARVHDNLATSGLRERVCEGNDIVISFSMPGIRVTEDLDDWAAFALFALAGGQFSFYPQSGAADYYHCVTDDEGMELVRVGIGVFSLALEWRIVPDSQAPAGPDVVLKKFYGVA